MIEAHHLPQAQLVTGQKFFRWAAIWPYCRFFRFNKTSEGFKKSFLDKPKTRIYRRYQRD